MAFEVVLKENVGNEIAFHVPYVPKIFTVSTLTIADGLLKKGAYYIPIEHILFIKEV